MMRNQIFSRHMLRTLLSVMIFMLAFMGSVGAEGAEPAPVSTAEPEKAALSVNGYELTYDAILPENIQSYLPQDELSVRENAVAFTVLLQDVEYPVFTMYINSDDGDTHTVLQTEAGDMLPVSFVMAPVPEELPDEMLQDFELAQGDVQILLATLKAHQLAAEEALAPLDASATLTLADYELVFSSQNTAPLQTRQSGNQVDFVLLMADDQETLVFTLTCGSYDGDMVAMADDGAGSKVPVAFIMAPLPEGLSDADTLSFYQAQELVNDVLTTMELKKIGG